jgi:hypothetical protein
MIMFCVTGCAKIFNDNFEADVVGNPPSVFPAGNPADDSLYIQGPLNSIKVINSAVFNSKAVEINRTGVMPQAIIECVTGGGPHTTGNYTVLYIAYNKYVTNIPALITTIQSSDGQRAFELRLSGGNYQLASGDGLDTLSKTYQIDVTHGIMIRIDMDVHKFWIIIDGTEVAAEKPFLDPGFADVHLLRFEYPTPILEAFSGTYVIDNIIISK